MDLGASFTGGSGTDNFYGSIIDDLGTGTTLNPGDSLSGGSGTDTLNITLSGNPTATFILQTNSVEVINLGNYDTNLATDATLNMASASGVTNFNTVNGSGDILVTGLSALATVGSTGATGDVSVTYASAVLAGSADTQSVTLSGHGLSTDSPTLTIADAASTSNIAETLAITSNGTANFLTIAASNNHTTLTVSGAGALTIDDNADTTLTKIDASASSGGVAITNIGASNLTMTGGSGNDSLRIDGSTINTSDSINGGAGTADSLILTVATNITATSAGAVITNFESVLGYASAADASLVVAQDASLLTGSPSLTQVGTSSWTRTTATDNGADFTATDGVNFTNLSSGTGMSLSGIVVTDLDANDGLVDNFTATADLATDTSADSISVTLGTTSAAMATVTALDANTAFNLTLALDDYETINLTSQGGTNTVASLTSGDATTLNITATKALTVTAVTLNTVATLNASASTANVSVAALTVASTITGGSGNDSLTGGANNDSITGGSGNDTLGGAAGIDNILGGDGDDSITGAGGNDILSGGAGDDTFADAAADLDTASTETASVSGGDGNDTFIIADFSDLSSQTTIDGGAGTADILSFTEDANHDFTASTTLFSNVSNVEVLSFTVGAGGARTITLNDSNVSNSAVTVRLSSTSVAANIFNMSGVLSSSNAITFTEVATGLATTYSIANGKDIVTMVDGNDAITVTNNAYLSSSDTIDGGAGTDTATFTSATNTTFTAAQLGALKNIETLQFTSGGAGNVVMTLTDAIVGANVISSGTFTVQRSIAADTGTLKVTGTDVTSSYKLALTGALGADTLLGGSGADTIFGGVNDADIDSMTGGSGNDTFALDDSAIDIITDFSFGTSSTAVDVLLADISDLGLDATLTLDTVLETITRGTASGAVAATDVLIITDQSYANAAAVDTALEANTALMTHDYLVIYQDTFGAIRVAIADVTTAQNTNGAAEVTTVDLAQLTGITMTGISSLIDITDFVYQA